MPDYPDDIKAFAYRTNHVDEIMATDFNQPGDEITSIERSLGAQAALSAANMDGTFVAVPGKNWGNLKARLDNLERGVKNKVAGTGIRPLHAPYAMSTGVAKVPPGTGEVFVPFPVGRFTKPPEVVFQPRFTNSTTEPNYKYSPVEIGTVTPAGMYLRWTQPIGGGVVFSRKFHGSNMGVNTGHNVYEYGYTATPWLMKTNSMYVLVTSWGNQYQLDGINSIPDPQPLDKLGNYYGTWDLVVDNGPTSGRKIASRIFTHYYTGPSNKQVQFGYGVTGLASPGLIVSVFELDNAARFQTPVSAVATGATSVSLAAPGGSYVVGTCGGLGTNTAVAGTVDVMRDSDHHLMNFMSGLTGTHTYGATNTNYSGSDVAAVAVLTAASSPSGGAPVDVHYIATQMTAV